MEEQPPRLSLVERIGARTLAGLSYAGGLALLMGATLRWVAAGLFKPGVKFGTPAVAQQMVRVGVKSTGIILLTQLFMGVILALQLTPPLAKPYHQEHQVSRIIGVGGFRMLAPILTAVVLSGFAGASIAAELGTMVVSEEIEAMQAIGLNPVRFLVVPRIIATSIVTVLLTVVSDLMIAFGGWATCRLLMSPSTYIGYWERMRDQLAYADFYTGLIMAGVFGTLISLIACHGGLKVSGGAEGVGKATTMTVVYSIVAIITSAAVFTMIFYVTGL